MKQVFVRAKPQKITVKETYYYKATVGDLRYVECDKAEGEIKIEFLYDGQENGSFGADARRDLKLQDPRQRAAKAQVGHLAILKAGQTPWKDRHLEGQTIPIEIDVTKLQEKLESGQKFVLRYTYVPCKPENTPVRLGDVLLTDQDPLHLENGPNFSTDFYTYPVLSIKFIAPLIKELHLSPARIKELIELGKTGQTQKVRFLPGQAALETIRNNLCALAEENHGGYLFIGIEPGGKISGLREDEESDRDLVKQILQAVLLPALPIPITQPIIQSVSEDDAKKRVGIIIVPPGLKKRFQEADRSGQIYINQDLSLDANLVRDLVESGPRETVVFINGDIKTADLVKNFVALANAQGGHIIFGAQEGQAGEENFVRHVNQETAHTYWEKIIEALRDKIKPALWPHCGQNYVLVKDQNKVASVLIFYIPGHLPEVYSSDGHCWQRQGAENKDLEAPAVFDLFKQRYETVIQEAVAQSEPPEITFGSLQWPFTTLDPGDINLVLPGANAPQAYDEEANIYSPSKYDPARGALEWHNVRLGREGERYGAELRLEIKNPEELRQTNGRYEASGRDLTAHFDITLRSQLLSGLEIAYYDALGEPLSAAKQQQILSQQTHLSFDVTLRVSDLFKKRNLSLYRKLEFEGVRPEEIRRDDVIEVLSDLGLRVTQNKPLEDHQIIRRNLPRSILIWSEKRYRDGKIIVGLKIANIWYSIRREISYGQRTDILPDLPSGQMTIEIIGWAHDPRSARLSQLLNQLQLQLKERFKYVKVS